MQQVRFGALQVIKSLGYLAVPGLIPKKEQAFSGFANIAHARGKPTELD